MPFSLQQIHLAVKTMQQLDSCRWSSQQQKTAVNNTFSFCRWQQENKCHLRVARVVFFELLSDSQTKTYFPLYFVLSKKKKERRLTIDVIMIVIFLSSPLT